MLALLTAPIAVSQTTAPLFAEEPNWQAVCDRAVAQPLPEAAQALAEQAAQSKTSDECNEQVAYYGFGSPPDYQEALRCAYRHRSHPSHVGSFVDGPGTLAMLYANGDGVSRDYQLAIRFACELRNRGGQNSEERIGRLEALRDGKEPAGSRFDLCDEQVSGAMGSYCEDLQQRLADVGRARRLAGLRARLPEKARGMLPELQAAETAFEKTRGSREDRGGGGSGAAGFMALDQGQLREQFVINLQRFASGALPFASMADRDRAGRELGVAYAAAEKMQELAMSMDVIPESVAVTERAWKKLLAEWMRFVPVAYPQLSVDAAATELIRLRTHQLRRLVPRG